jgi:dihydrofolate reductase
MRRVTCSTAAPPDGQIAGTDGDFGWSAPDEEAFRFLIDEVPEVGVHLLGRLVYETMPCWEAAHHNPPLDETEREWAAA